MQLQADGASTCRLILARRAQVPITTVLVAANPLLSLSRLALFPTSVALVPIRASIRIKSHYVAFGAFENLLFQVLI